MLFFYYQIGRIMESRWGVCKFNCYYFAGILLTDLAALIMNVHADITYLNLSLFLAFATLCPEDKVLLFFIIPLKMKWLALFYLASIVWTFLAVPFPSNLFPIAALLNYFLFFRGDVKSLLPSMGRYHHVWTCLLYTSPWCGWFPWSPPGHRSLSHTPPPPGGLSR